MSLPDRRALAALAAIIALALPLAACGDDDGADVREVGADDSASGAGSGSGSGTSVECSPVGDLASADTTVKTTLDEWSITVDAATVPTGQVGFDITNAGNEAHELVIVRDVAVADLPTDADGALDEDKLPDGALIGEVEAFPGGEDCSGTFELDPGSYTLLCNIVEQAGGKTEAHLKMGMATTLEVEAG